MSRRRLLLLLAPLGTLAGHALAYRSLRPGDGLHGYLGPVSVVLAVAGAALVGWLVVSRRGAAVALPRARTLATAQLAVFGAQELVERAVARVSVGDVLAAPVVRWGVGAQVAVAAVALLAIRVLRHLWASSPPWQPLAWLPFDRGRLIGRSRLAALVPAAATVALSRGPPVLV